MFCMAPPPLLGSSKQPKELVRSLQACWLETCGSGESGSRCTPVMPCSDCPPPDSAWVASGRALCGGRLWREHRLLQHFVGLGYSEACPRRVDRPCDPR